MAIALSANPNGYQGISGSSGTLSIDSSPSFNFGADTSGQLAGYRNRIINGDARVVQRPDFLNTVSGVWSYGGPDRMIGLLQGTTVNGTHGFYNGVTCSSGTAYSLKSVSLTGSGAAYVQQRIEAINTYDLNSTSVTFAVTLWQNTGSTQTVTLKLRKPTTTINDFSAQTDIGTPQNISILHNTYMRVMINVNLGASDASLGLAPTIGYGSLGAISPKDFVFADLQLEKGRIMTPFEFRPYGLELMLCQRYYEATTPSYYGTFFNGAVTSGSVYYSQISKFMTAKRNVPTVTFTNVGASAFPTTVGSVFNNSVFGVQESRTANATANAGIFGSSYTASIEL